MAWSLQTHKEWMTTCPRPKFGEHGEFMFTCSFGMGDPILGQAYKNQYEWEARFIWITQVLDDWHCRMMFFQMNPSECASCSCPASGEIRETPRGASSASSIAPLRGSSPARAHPPLSSPCGRGEIRNGLEEWLEVAGGWVTYP